MGGVAPPPDGVPAVSDEHRQRRRAAFERAAAAHLRAAGVHDKAVAFFELQGAVEKAARHRMAAEMERLRAQSASDAADAQ